MNADLLRETVRAMRANPDSTMEDWLCGTAGCLAGTRALLDGGEIERRSLYYVDGVEIEEWATRRFQLDGPHLLHVPDWPTHLSGSYYDADSHSARMDALEAAVEDYIATDGWTREATATAAMPVPECEAVP